MSVRARQRVRRRTTAPPRAATALLRAAAALVLAAALACAAGPARAASGDDASEPVGAETRCATRSIPARGAEHATAVYPGSV
ncbi:hypothetical protein, partial [Nocardia wallacei]|uniref:hypothetical protein n=1 Tax=Nocardia wallacei TaxID=480035 RepID=UPI0024543DB2